MKPFLPLMLALCVFAACQKEDLRAPDFAIGYVAKPDAQNTDLMLVSITNISSTPANTVSIRIDRYTDFNLVQDPILILVDKKLFQNDTAQFTFESSEQIKRVEITVEDVK